MKKILITAPVQQDAKIFKEYLWSLNRLEIPEGYEIHKYFYLHNADNLKKFLQPNEYELFKNDVKIEKNDNFHIWKGENYQCTAIMRTKALEKARNENYDYIFSVDSDVILHSKTLIDLLNKEKDIISKVYWTTPDILQPYITIPNFYDDIGREGNIKFNKTLNYYKIIDTYCVNVISNPLLISSKIFNNSSLNYYPIKILSTSYKNEYAFCIRCRCLFPDIEFYVDTIHPAKHLYRKEDYKDWIEWEKSEWK